ncbi:MAG TPA: lipocalin family protein, partial [Chitinophagaceae bacterium]|nr:lipocalin family protein [Chitinophagaceae bacterium]
MKAKTVVLYCIATLLLYSCSAPYQVSTNVKLKYTWEVSSVTVEGDLAGTAINAPVFEDATLDCLRGSKWSFFDDGGGNYVVNSTDTVSCLRGTRKITWEVVTLKGKSHYLQFYRYNAPKG